MSHYSENPRDVRVDYFHPSGWWHATISVKWPEGSWGERDLFRVLKEALPKVSDGRFVYSGMVAVCLEPCSQYAIPIMLVVP